VTAKKTNAQRERKPKETGCTSSNEAAQDRRSERKTSNGNGQGRRETKGAKQGNGQSNSEANRKEAANGARKGEGMEPRNTGSQSDNKR
jgi:hypothetical protein